jgi:hypothetical protein
MTMNTTQAQMPRYKCHKEVWALKIKAVEFDSDKARTEQRETDGSAILTPEDTRYVSLKVPVDYVRKHKPEAGGYYVVYEDGYKSFSPAKAFEEGYRLMEGEEGQRQEAELKAENERLRAALANIIPTNWCDPLLTGPNKVVGTDPDCQMIEALLRSLRQRAFATLNLEQKS